MLQLFTQLKNSLNLQIETHLLEIANQLTKKVKNEKSFHFSFLEWSVFRNIRKTSDDKSLILDESQSAPSALRDDTKSHSSAQLITISCEQIPTLVSSRQRRRFYNRYYGHHRRVEYYELSFRPLRQKNCLSPLDL